MAAFDADFLRLTGIFASSSLESDEIKNALEELTNLINETPSADVEGFFGRLLEGSVDTGELTKPLTALLSALWEATPAPLLGATPTTAALKRHQKNLKKRTGVVEQLITGLHQSAIPGSGAEVLGWLSDHLEGFTSVTYTRWVDLILAHITVSDETTVATLSGDRAVVTSSNAHHTSPTMGGPAASAGSLDCTSLELLPRILHCVSRMEEATYIASDGTQRETTGPDYKGSVLSALPTLNIAPAALTPLAAVLKDIPMSKMQLSALVATLCQALPSISLLDAPNFVYQLLLLASRGFKAPVAGAILSHFASLEQYAKSGKGPHRIEQVRQIQGTVLLHVNFAVKQDSELGDALLKNLTAESAAGAALTTWGIAVALAVSRLHHFETKARGWLKKAIHSAYADHARLEVAPWLRSLPGLPLTPPPDQPLLGVIEASSMGWDLVTPALVSVGVTLLETGLSSLHPESGSKSIDSSATSQAFASKSSHTQASKLGRRVLVETFQMHPPVRSEILNHIFSQVIARSPSASPCLDVLSSITAGQPQALFDDIHRLKEPLDYLMFLPPTLATKFIKAVLPVMKLQPGYADAVVLVLRKAMFSRDTSARLISVLGFVELLQAAAKDSPTLTPFAHDVFSHLHRSRGADASVRSALYKGLLGILKVRPVSWSEPVMELFASQLSQFTVVRAGAAPLALDKALDLAGATAKVSEPLPSTFHSLSQALYMSRANSGDGILSQAAGLGMSLELGEEETAASELNGQHQALTQMLDGLVAGIAEAPRSDWIDDDADFSLNMQHGQSNLLQANMAAGVAAAAMDHVLAGVFAKRESLRGPELQTVLTLFDRMTDVQRLIKDKTKGGKAKALAPFAVEQPVLGLNSVVVVLETLTGDSPPDHLIDSKPFLDYTLSCVSQQVAELKSAATEYVSYFARKVLPLLISTLISGRQWLGTRHPVQFGQQTLTLRSVDVFRSLVSVLASTQPMPVIASALSSLTPVLQDASVAMSQSSSHSSQIASNVPTSPLARLHRAMFDLEKYIDDLLEARGFDESAKLIGALQELYGAIRMSKTHGNQDARRQAREVNEEAEARHGAWLKQVIDKPLSQSSVASAVFRWLKVLPGLAAAPASFLPYVKKIHLVTGDIGSEATRYEADVNPETLLMLSDDNTQVVLPLIMDAVVSLLDDMEWAFKKLSAGAKAVAAGASRGASDQEIAARLSSEKLLYRRALPLASVLSVLCFTPLYLLKDTLSEQFWVILINFYNLLGSCVSYSLSVHKQHVEKEFVKLNDTTNAELTQTVYQYLLRGEADAAAQSSKKHVKTQSKAIPRLVYSIETYDVAVIKLGKAANINLLSNAKRSVNRDFRLDVGRLVDQIETEQGGDMQVDDGKGKGGKGGKGKGDVKGKGKGKGKLKAEDDVMDDAPASVKFGSPLRAKTGMKRQSPDQGGSSSKRSRW